jgi:uncharacterized protein
MKKSIRFEIKEITAEGTFEGLLSPYGNVDEGKDIVEAGAYTKTLKEKGFTRPMLWQHKTDCPIGELALEDRKEGLWCKGKLLMELPEAQKAYVCIKAKVVKGLSIGYDSIKDSIENGVRHLKEIQLWEGSIVTFPMNENALIASVKAAGTKGDFVEEYDEIQTLNGFYDMQSALSGALRSVIWSELERDEKIAAAETILEQFVDAFSAFFPKYIDTLVEIYGGMETWSAKRFELKERLTKAGAEFSTANVTKIKTICESLIDAHTGLSALVEGKAGTATLSEKAAEPQPEPVIDDHSAALLDEIRAVLTA